MKELKPIKAWMVVQSRLSDYYTTDTRGGVFQAHAVFPTRREAKAFAAQLYPWGENPIRVIKVEISPINAQQSSEKGEV